jgi:hypothetical protein
MSRCLRNRFWFRRQLAGKRALLTSGFGSPPIEERLPILWDIARRTVELRSRNLATGVQYFGLAAAYSVEIPHLGGGPRTPCHQQADAHPALSSCIVGEAGMHNEYLRYKEASGELRS